MAEVLKDQPVRKEYKDGSIVVSNVKSKIDNTSTSYTVVDTWYDGTPMDDTKVDGFGIYTKYKATGEYLKENKPQWGESFLEVDTVSNLRSLPEISQFLIKIGYYKGVRLMGYHVKGDTPEAIEYIPTDTTDPDDSGSIFQLSLVKISHNFIKNPNPVYFGAKAVVDFDNLDALRNVQSYCSKTGLKIDLGLGKTYFISDTLVIDSFRGGIVSDFGQNFYLNSKIKLLPTSTALVTVRVKAQGSTFRNISIEGRGAGVVDSVALQFKIVDEYPTTGTDAQKDAVNNLDCRIDGCIFGAAQTHTEFWGRQVVVSDCSFSGGWNGLRFKEYTTAGLYGGPSRAYRIYNCDFHSFDSGNANRENFALIKNETESGYGFHIVGNFSDAFNTFFKGNLVNSQIESNLCYNLVGYGVSGGVLSDSIISNNNFDNAQKYSDGSTNPPFNIRGGVFADTITRCVITGNKFGACVGPVISADGTTLSVITGNSAHRWGVASPAPVSAIKLDNASNTVSKSYSNTIDNNNFSQSFVAQSYIIETGAFDMSNFYGAGNRVRLSNGSTIINVFNSPNAKMSHGQTFRRIITNGENLNDLSLDINQISGSYSMTNVVSATVTGAPAADFYGVIHSFVSNIDVVQIAHRIRSNGNQSFIRRLSNGVVGPWEIIVQSTTQATTSQKGVVNQSIHIANVSLADAEKTVVSTASDVPGVVSDLNTLITKYNLSVDLVNSLKAQLNAKLAADRNSGQQSII